MVVFNFVAVKDDWILGKAFRFQNFVEDCRGRAEHWSGSTRIRSHFDRGN